MFREVKRLCGVTARTSNMYSSRKSILINVFFVFDITHKITFVHIAWEKNDIFNEKLRLVIM